MKLVEEEIPVVDMVTWGREVYEVLSTEGHNPYCHLLRRKKTILLDLGVRRVDLEKEVVDRDMDNCHVAERRYVRSMEEAFQGYLLYGDLRITMMAWQKAACSVALKLHTA